jgi:4-amino-4-deoxy-L-arabinose transferase-like glycosyltransferase
MKAVPPFSLPAFLAFMLVVGCAGAARSGFLLVCADGGWRNAPLQVQEDEPRPLFPEGPSHHGHDRPTELDNLADNVADYQWFGCLTPLSEKEELTAHRAPGYPWLLGSIIGLRDQDSSDWIMRWLQCALGSLTAGFYFLFARRAFHSIAVATLAGLLAALYPFWIINTAEINDGVLTGFLLGACLLFGTRTSQNGGIVSGFFFGLALAGLCMVRAAMLPFALIALLSVLWRCRRFPLGWVAAILALVGFVNGLAPWTIRNYQVFDRPVPIVTTTYFHLWMGNNPAATGTTLDESALRAALSEERLKALLNEPNQAKRYDQLAHDLWQEIHAEPTRTLSLRFRAALAFLFGEHWFKQNQFAIEREEGPDVADMPPELKLRSENILTATLLALFPLALLGWRWSYPWRAHGRLAAIAALWIPLPYILSHAEVLSGPRLPYDGVLLCYAAFAVARFLPGSLRDPEP